MSGAGSDLTVTSPLTFDDDDDDDVVRYLLSDPASWYSYSSVLNVHRVGASDCRHVLNGDSAVMVVNDSCLHYAASASVDHLTCHSTRSCVSFVECD